MVCLVQCMWYVVCDAMFVVYGVHIVMCEVWCVYYDMHSAVFMLYGV